MDRVILGKSPNIEDTVSPSSTYHRAGNTGLFVSKAGANVMSCSDGDLIFDTTALNLMQVLLSGTELVPKAISYTQASNVAIYTGIAIPYIDKKTTLYIDWTVLSSSSNLHQTAYSSSWNSPNPNDGYVVVPAYLNLDLVNLGNPNETGLVPGYSLSAKTYANTDNTPHTIDIEFTNGSPNREHRIAWNLYRLEI